MFPPVPPVPPVAPFPPARARLRQTMLLWIDCLSVSVYAESRDSLHRTPLSVEAWQLSILYHQNYMSSSNSFATVWFALDSLDLRQALSADCGSIPTTRQGRWRSPGPIRALVEAASKPISSKGKPFGIVWNNSSILTISIRNICSEWSGSCDMLWHLASRPWLADQCDDM